jgi:hypothetical protein
LGNADLARAGIELSKHLLVATANKPNNFLPTSKKGLKIPSNYLSNSGAIKLVGS